ncbi:MAG: hypothetical protein V1897_05605 [Pseudomonadota bacterium]
MKRSDQIRMAIRLKEIARDGWEQAVREQVKYYNRQIAKLNRELEKIRAGEKADIEVC